MKLGRDTASVTNFAMSAVRVEVPEVGMGATLLHWTDRTAATVTAWDGTVVTVQEDNVQRVDTNGMSETQRYEYTPNPDGRLRFFKRNSRGQWKRCDRSESGRWKFLGNGEGLLLGRREHYYDFSF